MKYHFLLLYIFICGFITSQKLIPVGDGWAGNSINTVVFRKNSVVSKGNIQFTAYYNNDGFLTIAKRKLNSKKWEITTAKYKGNIKDAHNSISIMLDGDGYLHVSWDHHGNELRYARSVKPYSAELGQKMQMTGQNETNVTYPEFYNFPNGDLIFMYRDGRSGKGNLVMNRYDLKTKTWEQLHSNLIDGENRQNAYWQACIDKQGVIHISWVWRSSPDVASNNSMCYARSTDSGKSWEKSTGEKYQLPINAANAEYAWKIPQRSELINQTSMTTDDAGNPFIATYWRDSISPFPQYRIIYKTTSGWQTKCVCSRKTGFSLSGGGTKRIPIARPQILVKGKSEKTRITILFRDEERDSKVSKAVLNSLKSDEWRITDLTDFSVGEWEPTYDTELWKAKSKLNIFVQKVFQVDGEGVANVKPEMVYILEDK